MIALLAIPILAGLDAVRGGWFPADIRWIKHVALVLMGWIIAGLCGYWFHWSTLVAIGGWYWMERISWGHPMVQAIYGETQSQQPKPHWWQFGLIADRPFLSK